jgi:hypothetical protein
MAQTTTTDSNTSTSNGEGKQREAKVMTPVEAISKIGKILDQLSPTDCKRVLAFFNASTESNA